MIFMTTILQAGQGCESLSLSRWWVWLAQGAGLPFIPACSMEYWFLTEWGMIGPLLQ